MGRPSLMRASVKLGAIDFGELVRHTEKILMPLSVNIDLILLMALLVSGLSRDSAALCTMQMLLMPRA